MEVRDARDCGQFQSKRSEVSASEIRELKDLGWRSTKRNILSEKQKVARKSIRSLDPRSCPSGIVVMRSFHPDEIVESTAFHWAGRVKILGTRVDWNKG
jgi:hypothetical protein